MEEKGLYVPNTKYKMEYVTEIPEGYEEVKGTTTQPTGYKWFSNGESRFGGKRKSVLVKVK